MGVAVEERFGVVLALVEDVNFVISDLFTEVEAPEARVEEMFVKHEVPEVAIIVVELVLHVFEEFAARFGNKEEEDEALEVFFFEAFPVAGVLLPAIGVVAVAEVLLDVDGVALEAELEEFPEFFVELPEVFLLERCLVIR